MKRVSTPPVAMARLASMSVRSGATVRVVRGGPPVGAGSALEPGVDTADDGADREARRKRAGCAVRPEDAMPVARRVASENRVTRGQAPSPAALPRR